MFERLSPRMAVVCLAALPLLCGLAARGQNPEGDRPELALQIGHNGSVIAVAFSADGRTLVSAAADGTVRLWDTQTGASIRSLSRSTTPVRALAVSTDGAVAAGSGDGVVRVWGMDKGGVLETLS